MTKDELKNRISLALKAPILQQGFEIICKENAELKKACDETQELLDKQIEATYKLDKENTELKEYNKYLKRKRQGGIQKQYNKVAIIKQQSEHLTKAKELLGYIVKYYREDEDLGLAKEINEAEQFLNSEVEK